MGILAAIRIVHAQGGPPFLTNDPGTPGADNWEINIGSMKVQSRGVDSYQAPQIDLNFGLGERVQLTYQVPYVVQSASGKPLETGWGNAYPGVKWRFLDQGEDGWQLSTFPQMETGASLLGRQKGIAVAGPRYLLPLEVTRKVGPLNLDFEAGYFVAGHDPRERILGFVAGRPATDRLELDAELYDDRIYQGGTHSTTVDIGGRYTLHPGIIALFMAGSSATGFSAGRPEFNGYAGVQVLLSHFGTRLNSKP